MAFYLLLSIFNPWVFLSQWFSLKQYLVWKISPWYRYKQSTRQQYIFYDKQNSYLYSKRSIITCQGQKKHLGQITLRYQRYQERLLWQSQSMVKRIRSCSVTMILLNNRIILGNFKRNLRFIHICPRQLMF